MGYGTRQLQTATDCARTLRFGPRRLTLPRLARLLAQLPALVGFLYRLPRAQIRLSDEPAGKLIAEHLALRRWGIPRFRLAQGVLYVPSGFATYLRGRKLQAVRTNIHRARDAGIHCQCTRVPSWTCAWPDRKLRQAAPAEHWRAFDREDGVLAEAWLTVDTECALLHSMASSQWSARWLLHTAIVERLCGSSCQLLVTNSYDVPLLSEGQQHFQHLLGYSVARLCPGPAQPRPSGKPAWLWAIALAAVAAIVGEQMLASPFELAGHRALVWLTALVAIRVATNQAGWATLVGGIAASAIALLEPGSTLAVPLAYFLCGVALDLELGLVPRLAQSARAISLAGASVIFVTLIAPGFPSLGHEAGGASLTFKPAFGAIVFGALSAGLGYHLGRTLRPGRSLARAVA